MNKPYLPGQDNKCADTSKEVLTERGISMLEYVFLVLLILLVLIFGVQTLGERTVENFHEDEFAEAFDPS